MNNLKIRIAQEGTTVPVEDIDLGQVTNTQLISEVVNSGQVQAPTTGHEYRFMGKDNEILTGTVTLKDAGFKNGDTITLLDNCIGASYYDSENDPADNDSGTGESSGEE